MITDSSPLLEEHYRRFDAGEVGHLDWGYDRTLTVTVAEDPHVAVQISVHPRGHVDQVSLVESASGPTSAQTHRLEAEPDDAIWEQAKEWVRDFEATYCDAELDGDPAEMSKIR